MKAKEHPPPSSLAGIPAPLIALGGNAAAVAAAAAQQKVTAAQSRASATDQELLANKAGIDPNFVSSEDNFGKYSHADIYQHAQALNVEGLRTAQTLWSTECTRLSDLSMSLQFAVLGLMANGAWQGQSGDAARTAIGVLGGATRQVAEVFSTVADRLDAAAWAAEATRLAIPPPTTSTAVANPNPDDPTSMIIPGLINPATATADAEARTAAENTARATMLSVYSPAFPTTGNTVPSFVEAPQFGQGGVPSTGSPGNSGDPASQGGSPDSAAAPASQEAAPGSPEDSAAESDPAASGDDSSGNSGGADSDSSPQDDGTTTPSSETAPSAASMNQPGQSPNSPTAGSPSGSPGGSGSPTPGGQVGAPTNGGQVGAPIAPGKAVPGSGTTSGPARSTAAGLANSGRPGTPGMGSMAPGAGARGKGGEGNEEHRAPDYLRSVLPDWLEGTEAAPTAFGADAISAAPVEGGPPVYSNPGVSQPLSDPPRRHEQMSTPEPTTPAPSTLPVRSPAPEPVEAPALSVAESSPAESQQPALSADIASLLAQHGLSSATQSTTPTSESR